MLVLSVVMLNIRTKSIMVSVTMLNVIMVSIVTRSIMLSAVMLNVTNTEHHN